MISVILTMLFLHGMWSRYGDKTPAEIEASARKYAEERGYTFEAINVSGDNYREQERQARARISQGGIAAVFGFSAGGYTAARIRKDYPNLVYVITGSPGVAGDVEIHGIEHMELVQALANGAVIVANGNPHK